MSKRFFVFILLVMLTWTAVAQQFRVNVIAPQAKAKDFTLLIYDTDSVPRVLKSAEKKSVLFTGTVRNGAAYAELCSKSASSTLQFFIENSDITINYNAAKPDASPIKGSRQNSIFRYQMEQCGESDVECLTRFIVDNHSSPVAPYILDRYVIPSVDFEMAERLYAILSGEACKTYHYHRVGHRLNAQRAVAPGGRLPNIEVTFLNGKSQRLDSLIVEGKTNVILVGATFCRQCNDAKTQISKTYPDLNLIAFDVDSLSGEWDAPLLRQLDIDHIPFILVVDSDRRIIARDVRLWEMNRIR